MKQAGKLLPKQVMAKLELQDKALCQDFIQAELLTEVNAAKTENIEDRYNYILNKLLFEQEKLYFDNLAEELFVSRSTLSADFRKSEKTWQSMTYKSKVKPIEVFM